MMPKKKNIPVKVIAEAMGVSQPFVRKALQERLFDWGVAVKMSGRWTYWINGDKFTESTGIQIPETEIEE